MFSPTHLWGGFWAVLCLHWEKLSFFYLLFGSYGCWWLVSTILSFHGWALEVQGLCGQWLLPDRDMRWGRGSTLTNTSIFLLDQAFMKCVYKRAALSLPLTLQPSQLSWACRVYGFVSSSPYSWRRIQPQTAWKQSLECRLSGYPDYEVPVNCTKEFFLSYWYLETSCLTVMGDLIGNVLSPSCNKGKHILRSQRLASLNDFTMLSAIAKLNLFCFGVVCFFFFAVICPVGQLPSEWLWRNVSHLNWIKQWQRQHLPRLKF